MPFSERVKYLAKSKSAFRCCVCHKPFVEIHHLIAKSEGGPSSLENAAPLCASCHDLYGGNPEKRKTLTQMRDHWWGLMDERNSLLTDLSVSEVPFEISEDADFQGSLHNSRIAIYHAIFPDEDFETSASTLMKLVSSAQENYPNRKRALYLDIDGHRNEKGGFDNDMFELQRYFLLGFLMQYLSELYIPMMAVQNNKFQRNDIPSELHFVEDLNRKDINEAIDRGMEGFGSRKGMLGFGCLSLKLSTHPTRLQVSEIGVSGHRRNMPTTYFLVRSAAAPRPLSRAPKTAPATARRRSP